jgi:prevent-host-death family protein
MCYVVEVMAQPARIPVRDLRNHVSEILRRVEAGETLEVTVNDRPVALLVPRADRPETVPTREFLSSLPQADPQLRRDLAATLTETTDDLVDPWAP